MVTVFGSVNLDLIATVKHLPGPGETIHGDSFVTTPGGKGANQALAAARAGAPVRMVGAIGRDPMAEQALSLLESGGVELSGLERVPAPTGVALILVDSAGENVIVVVSGANGAVSEERARGLDLSAGDILLLQMEIPEPAILAALRCARAAGVPAILNGAPYADAVADLAGEATHLILNEHECARLCGALGISTHGTDRRVEGIAGRLGNAVIVTLGRQGVVAFAEGELTHVPALAVEVLDTVGAGDTFCGYLAAGLHAGMAFPEALREAAAAGSLACTKAGAQPSIPYRNEVLGAMAR